MVLRRALCFGICPLLTLALAIDSAHAEDLQADPSTYAALVPTLQPGDTLHLAPGTYSDLLSISGLNGTESAWITITGPEDGEPAVFVADPGPCCNTVEISDSSYVALRWVTIDGNHVDGAFGLSAKGGTQVHHIRVEDCDFVNHDTSQQNVAISTKTPTWGWEIRRNRIVGVGTGMYLGDSDGTSPFIGGMIENNLIADPIGYCMQIKWQAPRPEVTGMPTQPTTTILRNNVFIKNDVPSPDGDRPNVLVGGFPASGPGSEDRYEIYGNFFFHNPRESLLQASGRVTIHDNVFVDAMLDAVLLADHDLPLSLAYVYNNTIYATGGGIHFGNAAPQGDAVVGNLVLSGAPISGTIADERDNLTGPPESAADLVANPSTTLGRMDFYPLVGACQGPAMDLTKMSADTDHALDFNGDDKAGFTFRGAYAGEGDNPGWSLDRELKTGGGSSPGSGGGSSGGTASGGDAGSSAGAGAGESAAGGGDEGCACRASGPSSRDDRAGVLAWLLFALVTGRRRRARHAMHEPRARAL